MTKSATIKSGIPTSRKARHAAVKSQLSTKTKVVIGGCAAILVLGGLIIAAMPDPVKRTPTALEMVKADAASRTAGRLAAVETRFNFGSISMARGKVTHRYWIRNAGTEPVVLGKMYTSCMCTTAALVKAGRKFAAVGMPGHTPIPALNERMNAGEEAIVEVIFDPAAHGPAGIGPIDRIVTIENNAGQPLELAFSANVTP